MLHTYIHIYIFTPSRAYFRRPLLPHRLQSSGYSLPIQRLLPGCPAVDVLSSLGLAGNRAGRRKHAPERFAEWRLQPFGKLSLYGHLT